MAKKQPRKSNTSTTKKTAGDGPEQEVWDELKPARAHRNETPEARTQRSRAPKTHPKTGTPGAVRKGRGKSDGAK